MEKLQTNMCESNKEVKSNITDGLGIIMTAFIVTERQKTNMLLRK